MSYLSQGLFQACPSPDTLRPSLPCAAELLAGSGPAVVRKMLRGLSVPGGKCCW